MKSFIYHYLNFIVIFLSHIMYIFSVPKLKEETFHIWSGSVRECMHSVSVTGDSIKVLKHATECT